MSKNTGYVFPTMFKRREIHNLFKVMIHFLLVSCCLVAITYVKTQDMSDMSVTEECTECSVNKTLILPLP